MNNLIKIEERKPAKYGTRSFSIPIPKVFLIDNNLNKPEPMLVILRGKIDGKDSLIIQAKEY